MTRRQFVSLTTAGAAASTPEPLIVPVHRVTNSRAQCTPPEFHRFWSVIWPEAVRDFSRCGIRFQTTDGRCEIRRTAGDRPLFTSLERGPVNLVLTDSIPFYWDGGRSLAGLSTLYEGYQLSMIALRHAHAHQVPFVAVNTCVHELLHVLLHDIFISRPRWDHVQERELRTDWYATRLWLFHDGGAIRESTAAYLDWLRSNQGALV